MTWLRRVLAAVSLVALSVVIVKYAPLWFDSTNNLGEIGRVRTALLAFLAGTLAVFGAYYTARSYDLNQEGQITDRFTRAVDQLGGNNVPVQVGGIYALERIAQDSRRDHAPILEFLAAYVREHTGPPPPLTRRDSSPSSEVEGVDERGAAGEREPSDPVTRPRPSTNVQAAMTVLGRLGHRSVARDRIALNLEQVDLRGANLFRANLSRARLFGAHLERANLRYAHLEHARLEGAHLQGAKLKYAHLEDARLERARLEGANLMDANLEGAHLAGANYNSETRWPSEFDPEGAGARRTDSRRKAEAAK